ncbi:MAG: hypothetical protein E2598_00315 [Sphingobium sp.]|nr:hypothetical protein [Sphingobium sp.]
MRESAYSRIKSSTNFAITRSISWANANWKWVTFLIWIGVCAYYLSVRQDNIFWFTLNDTDDNIRYVQVQDWLNGQGWYDLRQYRLDPPGGANIHWSRIVDIPIAGLILFFRLFMENGQADRWACAIAPMLPLFVLMLGLGFITRRLSAASSPAWIIAAIAPLGAPMGISMYMPLRIDHHGWQLAFMVLTLAGILDRKWMRGGVVAGLSTALSIAIGMEMMVYLAGAGGLIALRWVFKDGAGRRMAPYALSLGGGMGVMFALFASDANRLPMCDSISPIWVAVMGLVSAGMLILSMLPLRNWPMRLMAGAVVGGIIGGFALSIWPQCFTGAYQISPELDRLWLSHVREAKPITAQSLPSAISMLALPIGGAMAAIIACITVRRDTERLWAWATVTLMTLFALGLMFWQVRAGPAAQLLAIPAIAWAAYAVLERIIAGSWRVRIAAAFGGALLLALFNASFVYGYVNRWTNAITGGPPPMNASQQSAQKARTERLERIRRANARCRTLPALQALNALPPATIFTLVDLSPRLIATTHHSAIAGPYHRNEKAILDIHHAFDGNADNFRAIARRHGARYFLICPDFPEGTVYRSRSPNGFYAHAERGDVPPWMHQILLKNGDKLPYRLYRIED